MLSGPFAYSGGAQIKRIIKEPKLFIKFQKIVEYSSKVDADEMSNIVDDCACDIKMRSTAGSLWDTDQEPAILTHFDLPQSTLEFLQTLTAPPPVEVPALPKHQRKGEFSQLKPLICFSHSV